MAATMGLSTKGTFNVSDSEINLNERCCSESE
jgi:hypothetical protein